MLSVKKADALIVNMDDMMEEGIKDILNIQKHNYFLNRGLNEDLTKEELLERLNLVQDGMVKLIDTIENRRSNWGTTIELGWGLWLQKPVIIIAGSEKTKRMLEKHPFMRESSVIVESVEELLEKKWVQILYKSLSSTIY